MIASRAGAGARNVQDVIVGGLLAFDPEARQTRCGALLRRNWASAACATWRCSSASRAADASPAASRRRYSARSAWPSSHVCAFISSAARRLHRRARGAGSSFSVPTPGPPCAAREALRLQP